MRRSGATVLVAEDQPAMRHATARLIERAGMIPIEAEDGREALRLFFQRHPSVVVLDLGLPEIDGWQVLSRIREMSDVPVLLLTGTAAEIDKVRGLHEGADDYVTKPFGPRELIARLEALLRRTPESDPEPPVLTDELIEIDRLQRQVLAGGTEIELTPTEFRLLWTLMRNRRRVMSASELLEDVWGDEFADPPRVKVYVGYLRRKLGEAASIDPIETVRGFGYRYRPRRL